MGREKADERLARAIAAFPFERIEAMGEEALATWTELRRSRNGYPVVLGDDASLIALSGSSCRRISDRRETSWPWPKA